MHAVVLSTIARVHAAAQYVTVTGVHAVANYCQNACSSPQHVTVTGTHALVLSTIARMHAADPNRSICLHCQPNVDQCHPTLAGAHSLTLAGTHIRIHHLSDV